MKRVGINSEYIKLDQFLKWSGIADTGAEAKGLIQSGKIKVDGEVELKRGRKIRVGNVVEFEGQAFEVVQEKH
jgi:ribosome-associated protein